MKPAEPFQSLNGLKMHMLALNTHQMCNSATMVKAHGALSQEDWPKVRSTACGDGSLGVQGQMGH